MSEKLVHHYLANRGYKNGETRVSVETISEDLNINRKTVISATARLHTLGFITKDNHNRRKTIYRINKESVPPDGTNIENQLVPPIGINQSVPPIGISTVSQPGSVPPIGTRSKRSNKNNVLSFSETSFEYRLAVKLWTSIQEAGTSQKAPNLQAWAKVYDLMHRVDKRPYHFILLTQARAREDAFWRQNIRSPETLRKQLNAGKLDKYTPAPDEYTPDEELNRQDKHEGKEAA